MTDKLPGRSPRLPWPRIGITWTVDTGICRFTPVLVVLSGFSGLSFLTGYLDVVLIPIPIGLVTLTVFALVRRAP